MTSFPTSKIELHQWANSILLGIAVFFLQDEHSTIKDDHETIAKHETRITVIEKTAKIYQPQTQYIK